MTVCSNFHGNHGNHRNNHSTKWRFQIFAVFITNRLLLVNIDFYAVVGSLICGKEISASRKLIITKLNIILCFRPFGGMGHTKAFYIGLQKALDIPLKRTLYLINNYNQTNWPQSTRVDKICNRFNEWPHSKGMFVGLFFKSLNQKPNVNDISDKRKEKDPELPPTIANSNSYCRFSRMRFWYLIYGRRRK